MKVKVKILSSPSYAYLEIETNDWLEKNKSIEIISTSLTYNSNTTLYLFSILYKE